MFDSQQVKAVCARDWDDADAAVVCRQLGYQGGSLPRNISFSIKSLPTSSHIYGVGCKGDEPSLDNCTWSEGNGVCEDPLRARVACYGSGVQKGQGKHRTGWIQEEFLVKRYYRNRADERCWIRGGGVLDNC